MSSQNYCKELTVLTFSKQKRFGILWFMWKVYKNNFPENLSGLSQQRQIIYSANNLKYVLPNVNLDNTKNSLLVQGPILWNKLPADLKSAKTI